MKLRIEGNLLRLRLTQKEVACLQDRKLVECELRFSSGRALTYGVTSLPHAAEVSVGYEGNSILVVLPRGVVTAWAKSSQVTIEGTSNSVVQILVEKDFQCLHKPSERDPDAYPNPFAGVTTRSAG